MTDPQTHHETCGMEHPIFDEVRCDLPNGHEARHQSFGPGLHHWPSHAADPQTHHETCYREHHACAVARLDRLREAMEGMPPGATCKDAIGDYSDGRESYDAGLQQQALRSQVAIDCLLVSVRDITEGR